MQTGAEPAWSSRGRLLAAGTAAIGAGTTAVVALVPGIRFAYRSPDLHVALVTAETLIALLAAYLAFRRFGRLQRLDDLLLWMSLTFLGLSNFAFGVVPAVVASDTSAFATWASTFGRLVGHVLFAGAAFAGVSRVRRLGPRGRLAAAGGPALVLAVIAGAVALVEGSLPEAIAAGVSPEESGRVRLDGHWAVLLTQLVGFALYAAAAVGFTRRARRTGEALLAGLAIAAVLAAVARVNYALYPSLFTEWVYTGDVFRLLFYLVILLAALVEIGAYARGAGAAAMLEERRRMARDLHDGLAQELASIVRNLRGVGGDDRFVERARASADRALFEARRAIAALGDEGDERLDVVLAGVARAVADREGTRVVLDLARDVDVRPSEREALVLISSEAITNAARHGAAKLVRVELAGGRRPRLRIVDDGRGFDPTQVPAGERRGHGLVAMRERAEQIGASLELESVPGEGTSVEVSL